MMAGSRTPHLLTLLKINSHAQNLACWYLRGFPIVSNLFHIIILHTLPMGDSRIYPPEIAFAKSVKILL